MLQCRAMSRLATTKPSALKSSWGRGTSMLHGIPKRMNLGSNGRKIPRIAFSSSVIACPYVWTSPNHVKEIAESGPAAQTPRRLSTSHFYAVFLYRSSPDGGFELDETEPGLDHDLSRMHQGSLPVYIFHFP